MFNFKTLYVGAGLYSHLPADVFMFYQVADFVCQSFYISIFHKQTVFAIGDDVFRAAGTRERYGWYSTRHCFDDHHAESFET